MTHPFRKALLLVTALTLLLSPIVPLGAMAGQTAIIGDQASVSSLSSHPVIVINDDSELLEQAASEGWDGNGTAGSPCVIQNYDVNASGSSVGIYVGNITLHLRIADCHIHDGDGDGIVLSNVSGITVEGNRIANHRGSGLKCFSSENCSFISNIVIDDLWGICLDGCRGVVLLSNTLKDDGYGVYLAGSDNGTVMQNQIDSCFFCVYLSGADDNAIVGNDMYNSADGVSLWGGSDRNAISNNTVSNSYCGIYLNGDVDNIIVENSLFENTFGIDLDGASDNSISRNLVQDSVSYGIRLMGGSAGNTVFLNAFIDNNGAGDEYDTEHVQAFDSGANDWNNESCGNHWSDRTSPDADDDGIVDRAYSIGPGTNADAMPLTTTDLYSSEMDEDEGMADEVTLAYVALVAAIVVAASVILLMYHRTRPKA